MPQSSDDMHDIMRWYFGEDYIDPMPAMSFLKSRGYFEYANGFLNHLDPEHYMTLKEELCIRFLIEEWDFAIKPKENNNAS